MTQTKTLGKKINLCFHRRDKVCVSNQVPLPSLLDPMAAQQHQDLMEETPLTGYTAASMRRRRMGSAPVKRVLVGGRVITAKGGPIDVEVRPSRSSPVMAAAGARVTNAIPKFGLAADV